MTELKEWQKHIRHPRVTCENEALCGVTVSKWETPFVDVDHAFLATQQESRYLPCPACAKVVIDVFSSTLES